MTRRTQFSGSASGRRRERRAHLQSEASVSADILHRPNPSRVTLTCKRKPSMRAEVVTITSSVQKYEGSTCLPAVAIYSAGHRKVRKDATHIVK